MTSYDDLYEVFITMCMVEQSLLPKNDEEMYDLIHNAIRKYNNRARTSIEYDMEEETIFKLNLKEEKEALSNDEILIIAHYMNLITIENVLKYKLSIFTTFTKEIGVRNVNAQVKYLHDSLEAERKTIDFLFFNSDESTIM